MDFPDWLPRHGAVLSLAKEKWSRNLRERKQGRRAFVATRMLQLVFAMLCDFYMASLVQKMMLTNVNL